MRIKSFQALLTENKMKITKRIKSFQALTENKKKTTERTQRASKRLRATARNNTESITRVLMKDTLLPDSLRNKQGNK